MTIEVQTVNDQVVKSRLVRGKPVADIDALRKYRRKYYQANKEGQEPERCNCKFSSKSALARRWRGSEKCALSRLTRAEDNLAAELEMSRDERAANISSEANVYNAFYT